MRALDSLSPLCLGGNVFGWTADEDASFAVLDRYVEAGGDFVDTADMYSSWAPGHEGGESERVLGRWMASRGVRDRVFVATKVAKKPDRRGLSPANIERACEESLLRLQTDVIDLYYAHEEDPETPLELSLRALDALVRGGKVRALGLSNFSPDATRAAFELCAAHSLTAPVAVQPQYSLLETQELAALDPALPPDVAVFPYWALASGFLTGKYQAEDPVDSPRADGMSRFADRPQTGAVLRTLTSVAQEHGVPMAAVALAWCRTHPRIPSVIASARNPAQLEQLLPMTTLELSAAQTRALDAAARGD